MTEYEYRCPACGPFTVRRSMGSATPSAACPACRREGRRQFSALPVRRVQAALAGALERQEASADHPEVVRKVPPRPVRRRAPADPRQAALPRR
ncbi:MAG TPA: FmdB family zinc ribbon protein [Actinomycetota bacterium]|nr:FmdB family zinc ribbon protein [Actinomycetota bacterium]